jgi:hypothetical protein
MLQTVTGKPWNTGKGTFYIELYFSKNFHAFPEYACATLDCKSKKLTDGSSFFTMGFFNAFILYKKKTQFV